MTTGLLLPFKKEHHIRYFAASLQGLSGPYAKLDTNRMTLVHFATHALDLLGVWDNDELSETLNLSKKKIINWIYSLQRTSKDVPPEQVGFQGGTFLGPTINTSTTSVGQEYNQGHIAMTYTALCTLTALGDDLSRVDKAGIVNGLKALQRKDGSFQCVHVRSEHDMRFLYCACAVSYMLQDWSGVDIDRAVSYIESCRSFDGAIALIPEQVCIICRKLEVNVSEKILYHLLLLFIVMMLLGRTWWVYLLWHGRLDTNEEGRRGISQRRLEKRTDTMVCPSTGGWDARETQQGRRYLLFLLDRWDAPSVGSRSFIGSTSLTTICDVVPI
jgi:hypothetical protein